MPDRSSSTKQPQSLTPDIVFDPGVYAAVAGLEPDAAIMKAAALTDAIVNLESKQAESSVERTKWASAVGGGAATLAIKYSGVIGGLNHYFFTLAPAGMVAAGAGIVVLETRAITRSGEALAEKQALLRIVGKRLMSN